MKTLINIFRYGLFGVLSILSPSCDERKFLEEVPLDFFSPENSYVSMTNFESALTDLYARVREIHYGSNDIPFTHLMNTDMYEHARLQQGMFGSISLTLVPTDVAFVKNNWTKWYKVISNANTIISRSYDSELTEDQRKRVVAEAKFFRAFAYRYLGYLYGGVPLVLEEITSPKDDFTRTSREEVLNQVIMDFREAADNLLPISEVKDGRVSNLVALHYLAETYIYLHQYEEAVTAASAVINDPNTSLMTGRFGTRANENPNDEFLKFTRPGDVYWDLFQPGNQNRGGGNKEALWVIQMETDVPGGFLTTSSSANNAFERYGVPGGTKNFTDPDGKLGMMNRGRSNYNTGGRGVSFIKNTDWFLYTLWEDDWDNDIRNAPHNIIRDCIYDNPGSAYYGFSAVHQYPSPLWTAPNQQWRWYPFPSKITTPGKHPDALFTDKDELMLSDFSGSTYRDMYMLRLAETYLLRAEAYIGKGDQVSAADDINAVRQRSKAKPVHAAGVTLDYILDERARELNYEEQRRITLHRTGKFVERVRKHNSFNGPEVKDYHNLWPIPYSEIEANKNAALEQNPGY